MCCDGWNYSESYPKDFEFGECPECGEPVDLDGDALTGCFWSPRTCETCGARPCDGSC